LSGSILPAGVRERAEAAVHEVLSRPPRGPLFPPASHDTDEGLDRFASLWQDLSGRWALLGRPDTETNTAPDPDDGLIVVERIEDTIALVTEIPDESYLEVVKRMRQAGVTVLHRD
jgi:hypothetical protein